MQEAIAVLLACLVLTGLATAADVAPRATPAAAALQYYPPPESPAVTPSPSPAAATTAWDFITMEPDLRRSADLLIDVGLDAMLRRPFKGTLLLPTNAAWKLYVDQVNYIPTPDPLGGRSDTLFWRSLMKYHMLPRAVSTQTLPAAGITVGTNHLREPSGSLIRRHMLKMTLGATAVFVTPEQRPWVVKIVSRDNAVLGGGLIHVVDAVLRPDDLYASMNDMYARPELSNIKRLMAALNLTTMWSDSCIWISDDAYGGQAYEDMPQSDSDSCVPCWQSSVGCSNITYEPSAGVSGLQGSRRDGTSNSGSSARPSAFDDLVDVGKRAKRALASGTHGIERYAGTFILPSDTAFIKGLPQEIDPEVWEPIVQNHFVSAGSARVPKASNLLMSFDSKRSGGFPAPRTRRSFLGQMRNDTSYTHSYSATSSGCGDDGLSPCLTI
uniref:FAS1 domain-containing protein n=1 Tax=Tetradesmus obliquus TaxID=3088 RepID=A0A383VLT6_TETOB|eukprot:jgi/Sobl393_1/14596/SZX66508.1